MKKKIKMYRNEKIPDIFYIEIECKQSKLHSKIKKKLEEMSLKYISFYDEYLNASIFEVYTSTEKFYELNGGNQ